MATQYKSYEDFVRATATTKTFPPEAFEARPKMIGDQIAAVAQPIAHTIDAIFGTNIANCGGCKEMQDNLNAGMPFAEALKQRLTPKT